MEHAQRKTALRAGHLIVIQLHRIDGTAAELVVLRVRPEDGTQQHARTASLWMNLHQTFLLLRSILRSDVRHKLKNYSMRVRTRRKVGCDEACGCDPTGQPHRQ